MEEHHAVRPRPRNLRKDRDPANDHSTANDKQAVVSDELLVLRVVSEALQNNRWRYELRDSSHPSLVGQARSNIPVGCLVGRLLVLLEH